MNIFRRENVRVLARANDIGSPSEPTSPGYASTSSKNKYLIGFDLIGPGALDPTIAINPPLNSFNNVVFPESLDLASFTLSRNTGDSSINGSKRVFELSLAMSTVGNTANVGPGA